MLADCPAIILEMEEDRLMKMMLWSRKETLKGEVTEIKTEQFFPANKKKEKTEEFSRFYYFWKRRY
jgi:hypothetical protein